MQIIEKTPYDLWPYQCKLGVEEFTDIVDFDFRFSYLNFWNKGFTSYDIERYLLNNFSFTDEFTNWAVCLNPLCFKMDWKIIEIPHIMSYRITPSLLLKSKEDALLVKLTWDKGLTEFHFDI
jgi:hypothetical protein